MGPFIRIAFWIATLFGCLQAVPLPCSEGVPQPGDSKISIIQKSVICENDSRLYTPENVKEQCISSALECIVEELNGTAQRECTDEEEYIGQEVEFLQEIIKHISKLQKMGLVQQTQCSCEEWPERSFSEFVSKTSTLQEQSFTLISTRCQTIK